VNDKLRRIASRVNKQQKVQLVRFTYKTVFSPERKPILFITNLKITTDTSSYFAQNKNRDFMESIREVVNQIRKQLRRTN
jgi:ribosome-associated translation inhibitor RaiA